MRMCAVTRQVRPIDELIRFVVSPSGEAVPDLKRKLPGRGLWVSASHRTVAEAARRNHFSKGFKRDVRAAATLAADTEALLVRSVVEALAMAAKAGQVVSGFSKVEGALGQRQALGPDPCLRWRGGRNPQIGRRRPAKCPDWRRIARISGRHGR